MRSTRERISGERCGWGRWERNNGRRVAAEARREAGRGLNKDAGVADGVERKASAFPWTVCLAFSTGRVGLGASSRWPADRRMSWQTCRIKGVKESTVNLGRVGPASVRRGEARL